jgi:alkylhydroperoxidase family enzyme
MTQRIPPAAEPFDELARKTLDRIPDKWNPPFMIFRVLARDSRLLQRYINGAASYLEPSHITVRQREVFLLRVTGLCRCAYEWGLRVHFFAEASGLSESQIRATTTESADDPEWTPQDHLLLDLAGELHKSCTISDALWDRLNRTFAPEAILQLLMIAGHYRMTAYISNSLRLPIEPGRARPFPQGA